MFGIKLNERLGNGLWRLVNAGVFLGGLWWWLRTVERNRQRCVATWQRRVAT